MAEVDSKALVNTLAKRIALKKVETLAEKLADVEVKALIKTLPNGLAEVELEALGETVAEGRPKR